MSYVELEPGLELELGESGRILRIYVHAPCRRWLVFVVEEILQKDSIDFEINSL